jgi:hypothetical protein
MRSFLSSSVALWLDASFYGRQKGKAVNSGDLAREYRRFSGRIQQADVLNQIGLTGIGLFHTVLGGKHLYQTGAFKRISTEECGQIDGRCYPAI